MAVSPVTSVMPAAAATPAGGGSPGTSSAAEQQDRFMKLLVAQMKNQDPLNPMDNAQMTSQIAQINTVSGIERLNLTVESLLKSFNGLQAQSAMQLPGRSVLVEGASLTLDDSGATGGIELGQAADAVQVEILNANGQPVRTLALGGAAVGVRSFRWDGQMADGQTAPVGTYTMRATASSADKQVPVTVLGAARVQSVTSGSAGIQVDLGSAGVRAWGDIKSFL